MKICYQNKNFAKSSRIMIRQADEILAEYAERGIIVTLRQLYYQFVARDIIPNKQSEYKRLGSIVNDARMAGLIDWDYLQDRTRNLQKLGHWDGQREIIEGAARSYHRDLWRGQENYVEVWIEKDALVGVIESVCDDWDVPYFSCREYTSQSEMWSAGQRLLKHACAGRTPHIIHLGDHDPSGRDMSRDIDDRMKIFLTHHVERDFRKVNSAPADGTPAFVKWMGELRRCFESRLVQVHRIALNMDQVEKYSPPPNPTKITDSRSAAYINEFGRKSWELDALDPDVLVDLIESNIRKYLDEGRWEEERARQEKERKVLTKTSERWEEVADFLASPR